MNLNASLFPPLLQARDLRKSYAGKPALQGVSLQLFPG
ncbi:MAG: transporter ATP-binding protein, partial [Polaromonas sp.]|nr:transporter ATP-binding protein [Polaromonas sp.]